MHIESSFALFGAIALILTLIKLKKHVGFAVLAGAFTLAFTTLPAEEAITLAFSTLISNATLKLMLILFSVLFLSYTMENAGMLESLTKALSQVGGKSALITVPLIIGLLPMPGGALVSAIMISGLVKEMRIAIEGATFANYWFRHIWIPSWPLYPAFIITLGVVELSTLELVKINLPLTVATLFSGILLSRSYIDINSEGRLKDALPDIARNAWPIAAIILLAMFAGVELALAILAVLVLTLAYTRPSMADIKKITIKALDPKMAVLIYAVMLFRNGIEASSAAVEVMKLLSSAGLPLIVVAPLVSFLIGFAVGIEMGPPSIALPLFISFIGKGAEIIPEHLLLVFSAGYLGVQLSPMHLCFTVTADYFKASISSVYRYTIAGSLLSFVLVVVYILFKGVV